MSVSQCALRPARLSWAVLSLAAVNVIAAADLQQALGDSPFGSTPAAAPASAAPDLEFRGMVREGAICLVNLYQPAAKSSRWIAVGEEAGGVRVKGYDAATARVTLVRAGRELQLPLKQARVAQLGGNPVVPLTPAEQAATATPADLPEHLRELPPEARKLLEDVRRRQPIKWPAVGSNPPVKSP